MLAALKTKTSSLTISSVLTSESSNNYNSRSGKRDNESAICFAFLMQPTGKYCPICHTEYPEFQSGILGPYFYVLFEFYYYYYYFLVFFFFFTYGIFFPLLGFSLLRYSLLVTPLLCLVTPPRNPLKENKFIELRPAKLIGTYKIYFPCDGLEWQRRKGLINVNMKFTELRP